MWPDVSSIEGTCRIIALFSILATLSYLTYVVIIGENIIISLPVIVLGFGLMILSIMNFVKPRQDLAYKTFKYASIFLILSFFSLFFGIIINLM